MFMKILKIGNGNNQYKRQYPTKGASGYSKGNEGSGAKLSQILSTQDSKTSPFSMKELQAADALNEKAKSLPLTAQDNATINSLHQKLTKKGEGLYAHILKANPYHDKTGRFTNKNKAVPNVGGISVGEATMRDFNDALGIRVRQSTMSKFKEAQNAFMKDMGVVNRKAPQRRV